MHIIVIMEKQGLFIESKYQEGTFNLVSDILNAITLPEEWVLWHKEGTEYIFFSRKEWTLFIQEMQKESWMTIEDLEYTNEWVDFTRWLFSKWTFATTKKNSMLHIDRSSRARRTLAEWIYQIEICI